MDPPRIMNKIYDALLALDCEWRKTKADDNFTVLVRRSAPDPNTDGSVVTTPNILVQLDLYSDDGDPYRQHPQQQPGARPNRQYVLDMQVISPHLFIRLQEHGY